MAVPACIQQIDGGVLIRVKVVPNASRQRVVGTLGNALKLAVAKPAAGGQANRAVEALLAERLDVRPGNVAVVSGHASPAKVVRVTGTTLAEAADRLSV